MRRNYILLRRGGYKTTLNIVSGIIVPFSSTSIPSGWDDYTSTIGNSQYIRAVGSAALVGDAGGSLSNYMGISGDPNSNHPSGGTSYNIHGGATTGSGAFNNEYVSDFLCHNGSSYSCNHQITVNHTPNYQDLKFIKANTSSNTLPVNSVVFTNDLTNPNSSGYSDIYYDNNCLRCTTGSISNGGTDLDIYGSVNVDSVKHMHVLHNYNDSGVFNDGDTSRYHTHLPIVNTYNWNLKRVYLKAWKTISSYESIHNKVIAMWESDTPPAGWAICNGLNDTVDLTDYFIMMGDNSNIGTKTGNNNKNIRMYLDNTIHTHSHGTSSSNDANDVLSIVHSNDISWSHLHNYSILSGTFIPPTTNLIFIQTI